MTHFGYAFHKSFERAFHGARRDDAESGNIFQNRVHSHILMGMFTHVYLRTFIKGPSREEHFIAQLQYLGDEDQLEILAALRASLDRHGIVP
jgi:hypothetical protein